MGLITRILVFLVLTAIPAAGAGFLPMPADVVKVLDGDTVRVKVAIWIDQEILVSVRLPGIDAPEVFRPECAQEKKHGELARIFAEDFLDGHDITIHDMERGKYAGRIVARIEADGRDLGTALLDANLATTEAENPWCRRG